MITRSITCLMCHKRYPVSAPAEQFAAWESGVLAQRAFPGMSEDDRELLISQTCGTCFDAMFEGLDEEEEADGTQD